jgi:hypothetical protein
LASSETELIACRGLLGKIDLEQFSSAPDGRLRLRELHDLSALNVDNLAR